MAQSYLLGTFAEPAAAADALEAVRLLGVPEHRVSVISSLPIRPQVLGRSRPRQRLGLLALMGALLGIAAALILLIGTPLLYPIQQGGQPLIPIPPSLIITFELAMLGTMGVTFIGFIVLNRFPQFGRPPHSPRIGEGQIGVEVETDEAGIELTSGALRQHGALDVLHFPEYRPAARLGWQVWLAWVVVILTLAGIAGGLWAYDFIHITYLTQMEYQPSTGAEQGPRLAAPAESAPVQGPVLVAGQPATQPKPSSANSLQRGQVLYGLHCALCHNASGRGDGPLASLFQPTPADLTGADVKSQTAGEVFLTITNGSGVMPSIREDLTPEERWDVVNWVRQLQ